MNQTPWSYFLMILSQMHRINVKSLKNLFIEGPQMVWMVGTGNKTWWKCEYCVPMETSIEGVCCLEVPEICKPRFPSTSFLWVYFFKKTSDWIQGVRFFIEKQHLIVRIARSSHSLELKNLLNGAKLYEIHFLGMWKNI